MGLTGSSVGVHCAESVSPSVCFDAERLSSRLREIQMSERVQSSTDLRE